MNLRKVTGLALVCALASCAQWTNPIPLFPFLPPAAVPEDPARLRGVQAGLHVMTGTTDVLTLAQTIDVTSSFVICSAWTGTSTPDFRVACNLSASGELVFHTYDANRSQEVAWYVVEFESGVKVQRGIQDFTGAQTEHSIALTETRLARSFVLSSETGNASPSTDERMLARAVLGDNNRLELSRGEGGAVAKVAWQVVEMDGARVQRGTRTMVTTCETQAIVPVNLGNSFVLLSLKGDPTVNGVDGTLGVRAHLSGQATLQFERGSATAPVMLSYQVVTFPGLAVERGTLTDPDPNHLSMDATLSRAFDVTRTFAHITSTVPSASPNDLDAVAYNARFLPPSTVRVTRAEPDGVNASVSWSAIEFE